MKSIRSDPKEEKVEDDDCNWYRNGIVRSSDEGKTTKAKEIETKETIVPHKVGPDSCCQEYKGIYNGPNFRFYLVRRLLLLRLDLRM